MTTPTRLPWTHPRGLWFLSLGLAAATQLFVCLHVLARLSVLALDDTFIYFNYAKNLAAGNGFVFDPRMIPSEGFTSLLYLLMLVPWEMAGANPMTGAVLYNALAGLLFANLLAWLAFRQGWLNRWMALVLPLLLLAAFCLDKSVRLVTFRGLETLLGPPGVLLACGFAAAAARHRARFESRTMGFMLVSFATFLIRPEYLAYLGLVGAALLLRRSTLRQVWRPLLFLLALLAALLCWKLWVFGEPLPTAFYRKLPGAATNGPSYVFRFFKAYALLWLAVAAALAIRPRLLRHPLAQGLLLACLANVLFVLRMQVLIGYGFRFLILPLMVAYGLVGVALCQGLQSLPFRRPGPWLAMAGLAFLAAGRLRPLPFGYPQAWNLASRARAAFERDPYMLFAEQLKKHLPEPERFTLVFGDAGTLPYALGCRYIDPNGLSEPAIARLFRLPDGPEKTGAFVARLFDPQPDMVILPLGGTPDARGNFILGHNAHDPFRGVIPEPYWLRLVEDGFLYACTLDLHYPVHVALRRSSPHFEALLEALRGYSDFHLPPTGQGGLLVLAPDFRIQLPGVDP